MQKKGANREGRDNGASRAAAGDAAWDALKPTTEWLQASAQQLVIRMCELRADADDDE